MRPDLKPGVGDLDRIVLGWTIDDIMSAELFKTRVSAIPMEFSSTKEYLRAFRVPLLEEVRAQLHQRLDKSISNVQSAPAIIRKIVGLKKRLKSSKKTLLVHLRSTLPVKTSDLILLCSAKPRWDAKRECLLKSGMFVLACVADTNENSPVISATIYLQDESPVLKELKTSSEWHAVLPGVSLTPARRIWNAISESKTVPQDSVIHTILQIKQQEGSSLPQTLENDKTMRRVDTYSNSRGLNESQRDVLKSAVAALLPGDVGPHVRVVQGPPGTGKTAMLVTLISVLGCLRRRTLVSAPTNAAVVEISKRMMTFFEISKNEEMFFGFCSRTDAGSKRCFPVSLSDLVLLGSKEKMQVAVDGTTLEKIFLHHRIIRLQKALNPTTGWKATVQSVVKLLTMAPSIFVAQESTPDCKLSSAKGKKKKMPKKEKKKQPVSRNASFWSFARESMAKLKGQMQKTSAVLTSDLPSCHINMATSNAMTSASNLMANLVNLMPLEAPAEAMSWFSATSILSEAFTALNFSDIAISTEKMKFLQAREALLEALKAGPGCSLFATGKHPKGRIPSPACLKFECLRNATLVFSTVSGAGSPKMAGASFECAIIDEASQLVEAETTIITRMKGLKQLILVGDHKQLPATVISKVAENCGYGRSLFDRLQALQHGYRHMLNIQYRMKPEISRFPNSWFYEGKLQDGPNVALPTYGSGAGNFGPCAFLDCQRGVEVAEQKSWKNPKEVEVVVWLVTSLGKVCAERNIKKLSVGVISPYVVQVKALEESLRQQALHPALQVDVKTVDGFQGNERDVILFSAVRSNSSKKVGFVDDSRRLNVAITRGRFCVWIVGNATTLSGGSEIWKKLVADAKANNYFHTVPAKLGPQL